MDKLKKMESIKIMEAQEPVHLADLHLPEDLRDLSLYPVQTALP